MAVTSSIPSAEKVPTTKSTLWQEEMRAKEQPDGSSPSPVQGPSQSQPPAAGAPSDPRLESKDGEQWSNSVCRVREACVCLGFWGFYLGLAPSRASGPSVKGEDISAAHKGSGSGMSQSLRFLLMPSPGPFSPTVPSPQPLAGQEIRPRRKWLASLCLTTLVFAEAV